ncbi:hypothetical protein QW1_2009 [Clostridioides difficile P73]|nr:hypothetical protein QAS_2146 [Clostridioides difficile CD9]EQE09936.1 hypothetical protein QAQ_2051 [Clostridioides difficile CD8]EQJ07412.1 hypothetical protein QQU_2014 [Clostridioides difficile P7]EQJ79860.1 hypothetical protein QU7_2107 [Clostridioides difficile P46]EQK27913.1 hypothetical protein QW1_2009 [Clostridioides difficile P73]EQK33533.1 hypothetical protein QW5_2044 [Clostridioides difficile P75]ERM35208.1 hypothetical protein QU1_2160 [Clostridioides difficile P37]
MIKKFKPRKSICFILTIWNVNSAASLAENEVLAPVLY